MLKLSIYFLAVISCCFIGCRGGSKTGQFAKHDTAENSPAAEVEDSTPQKTNYKIYIENSASMDGYISKPASQLKDVLMAFMSDIPTYLKADPSLYFVNTTTCEQLPNKPTNEKIHFIQNLNPAISKKNCPPSGNSLIDNVIDQCTQDMGHTVSVVVSDCIFSLNKAGKATLPVAEADLKMFMSQKLDRSQLSTIIVKYNSDFSGAYYTESKGGKPVQLPNGKRPFYVLVFGKANNLSALIQNLHFKNYPGFEASYCLLSGQQNKKPDAAITYQNKAGSFSFEKPASKMVINEAKPGSDNVFQFSININLGKISVEETYLLDPANYSVNDNFKVVAVSKISEPADGYTHNITLSTTDLQQTSDLKLGLKYDLPRWVEKTGTETDDEPSDTAQQKKTFGFKSLMLGIATAYKAKNGEQQFSIPIQVSRGNGAESAHKSFPWWIIIALLAVVGIFIFLKNKK